MKNRWVIKCSYPHGSHIVMMNDERLRFENQQDALARAEVLNATTREGAERAGRQNNVTYIVTEEM